MSDKKSLRGLDAINDATVNQSTAFSQKDRDQLGLRGLLPHHISTMEGQKLRVLENMRRKNVDIERYVFLSALQHRNERLFYRTVIDNIDEIMPLIYTPTVGQACMEFAHIFRIPKGFYITPDDQGNIRAMLDNWPVADVRVIVITDGQRILGLGDLGANGMGIPIGKLSLYIACAGIEPGQCLPVMFDVGTNNEELLNDPLYLGYPSKRIGGETYSALMQEFVDAVQDKYPKAMIQFEDFLTPNAYSLLERYKDEVLCFNDDIQGTASVTLSGVYASTRISGTAFKDLRIMFLGAGSAATGIGDLMVTALEAEGLSQKEALDRLWYVDIEGLLVSSRTDLMEHNLPYAHDVAAMNLLEAIEAMKPHVLIGATGAPGTFTKDVIEAMCKNTERPAIFALSNPTSRAECTAEDAYIWSNGQAIFTSGSPFDKVTYEGQTFQPGQGNNAYIFPGVGLGAVIAEAEKITDEMFLAAARTLSGLVTDGDLARGTLYPPLDYIRDASLEIAVAVASLAVKQGIARAQLPDNLKAHIKASMYDPRY